jgi:hypothetical protein
MDKLSSKVYCHRVSVGGRKTPSCGITATQPSILSDHLALFQVPPPQLLPHPSFSPLGLVAFFLFLALIPLLSFSAHPPVSVCAYLLFPCSSSFTHLFLPSTGSRPARTNATHTTRLVSGLSFTFFLFLALIFLSVLCPPAVSADNNERSGI